MTPKTSEPHFSKFIPFGYQREVIKLLHNHDYSIYTPEIMLSGSVGSSKSILAAHLAISHCLRFNGARIAISRQSLPDLRKTIYQEIIEHCQFSLTEGKHFNKRDNTCDIKFSNGSEIIAVSFGDKRFSKVRSLKLSGLILEEATDFDDDFYAEGGGFMQFKARLRRIHNVPENWMILATNPGDPDSNLYRYFIEGHKIFDSRYVFYSNTEDNPFLDPVYIKQLKQDYSPMEAERYIRGKWISLDGKGIYAAYSTVHNYKRESYIVQKRLPVRIAYDFNIGGSNKPMSCVLFQYDPKLDTCHFFNESVIDGAYVEDIMDDLYERGLLNYPKIIIHGDATGRARHTSSKKGNYDIIREYLETRRIEFEMKVPRANPPVRTRHIKMNAYCKNDLGEIRLYVYKDAKTAHEGMRLTKLKKGAGYVEDDSKPYQHITTAMGYGLMSAVKSHNRKSKVIKL